MTGSPTSSITKIRDLSSQEGAFALARELDEWWHSRGFSTVQHWPERIPGLKRNTKRHESKLWGVRSNLVDGMPPKPAP